MGGGGGGGGGVRGVGGVGQGRPHCDVSKILTSLL